MDKNLLLGTAAALTLVASGAFAAPTVLWDQTSNLSGGNVASDNDAAGADDFTVPSGQTWQVSEVDVTGAYFNSSGPAASEVVTFYNDKNGKPGRMHGDPATLNCADNLGSFKCTLPSSMKLKPGTYWISLVANCDFQSCGQWGWLTTSPVQGNEAVYRAPDTKCAKFKPLHRCFGGDPADLAFKLLGKATSH